MSTLLKDFVNICYRGNLKDAKLFYEKHNNNLIIPFDEIFTEVCLYGHLQILKFLWKIAKSKNIKIDICYHHKRAFSFACSFGHLDVIKWLWKKGKNPDGTNKINIFTATDLTFMMVCMNGKLEVLKWLVEIGKNPDGTSKIIFNDFTFRCACGSKHIDVINYLCEINPIYSYRIENNEYVPLYRHPLDYIYESNDYNQMLKELNITKQITSNEKVECLICHMKNEELEDKDKNIMVYLNCGNLHCCHVMCLYSWYVKNNNNKNCIYCKKDIKISECTIIKNSI